MLGIYEFHLDCGRMGNLGGVFIADSESIKNIQGKRIYFGEVLGKHSEVRCIITKDMIKLHTEDQDFITKLLEIIPDFGSGYNPLDYWEPEDEEDIEEEE